MGYLTDYKIKLPGLTHKYHKIRTSLFSKTSYQFSINYLSNSLGITDVSWYTYDKDIKNLSEEYPDTLITVKGNGETNGDMWVAYFKNGKSYRVAANINYPEFDEKKFN